MIPYSLPISNRFIYLSFGSSIISADTTPMPPPGRLAKITPKPMGISNKGSYFLAIPKYSNTKPTSNISRTPGCPARELKAVISYNSSSMCMSQGLGKHNQYIVLVHIGPIAHNDFLNRSGLVKLNGIISLHRFHIAHNIALLHPIAFLNGRFAAVFGKVKFTFEGRNHGFTGT